MSSGCSNGVGIILVTGGNSTINRNRYKISCPEKQRKIKSMEQIYRGVRYKISWRLNRLFLLDYWRNYWDRRYKMT